MASSNPQLDLSFPVSDNDLFHFDDGHENFDALSHQNGFVYWYSSDLMSAFGYKSHSSFEKPIQRAIQACVSLGIDIMDNFVQDIREVDGAKIKDYRLSRFACYLVAMNADPKKVEVARAQAYFAALAETFRRYIEQAEDVERVAIRDEMSEREKSLTAAASASGVQNFAYFQSAGYRGMYNMSVGQLRTLKKVPGKRSPLDFMGKEELAANLFRVTQTEAKLRNESVKGQKPAEYAAETVGRKVRNTMIELSGTPPERLPPSEDIKKVKSAIKSSAKDFKKLDA